MIEIERSDDGTPRRIRYTLVAPGVHITSFTRVHEHRWMRDGAYQSIATVLRSCVRKLEDANVMDKTSGRRRR